MPYSSFAGQGTWGELELEQTQTHMTQKPMRRVEVGACRFAQPKTQRKDIRCQASGTFPNAKVGFGERGYMAFQDLATRAFPR